MCSNFSYEQTLQAPTQTLFNQKLRRTSFYKYILEHAQFVINHIFKQGIETAVNIANTLHLSVAYDKIGIRVSFFLGDAPTPVHTYIDLTNISSPGTTSHSKAPSSVKSN